MDIIEFEAALQSLVRDYLTSLAPWAPTEIKQLRLDASGGGLGIVYDKLSGADGPTLSLSLSPAQRDAQLREHGEHEGRRRR